MEIQWIKQSGLLLQIQDSWETKNLSKWAKSHLITSDGWAALCLKEKKKENWHWSARLVWCFLWWMKDASVDLCGRSSRGPAALPLWNVTGNCWQYLVVLLLAAECMAVVPMWLWQVDCICSLSETKSWEELISSDECLYGSKLRSCNAGSCWGRSTKML